MLRLASDTISSSFPDRLVWHPAVGYDVRVIAPLTKRDLAMLAGFSLALIFATGPRVDIVAQGMLLYVALTVIRPSLALAMVAATLPVYAFPQENNAQPLGLTETALLLSAAGVGLRWLLERSGRPRARLVRPHPTGFDWPISLFLLAALTSLLASHYLQLSLRELRVLILEPVIYFYLLAAVLRSATEARRVVEAFLLAAFAVALVGAGQSVLGLSGTEAEGVLRAVGTFASPNHLGLHLGRAAPFLLAGLLFYQGWRRRAYAVGLAGVGAGIIATFSIGAWLGVGVAVAAVAATYWQAFPTHRRVMLAVFAVAGITALVAAIPLLRLERFTSHLDLSGGTSFYRLQLWHASLAMALDHPILGVGLDNFLYLYQQSYLNEAALEEPNLSHPHNIVLHFWLQLGMLGLVSAGWLLVAFFSAAHRVFHATESPLMRALTIGAAASMIDFVVHGMVDNSYFLPDLAYLFWISLGAVGILAHASEQGSHGCDSRAELRSLPG